MLTKYNFERITHTFINAALSLCIAYAALSNFACSRQETGKSGEAAFVDSVMDIQYDTIFYNPNRGFENLTEAQSHLTDSIQYFRLDLYKALSRLIGGDTEAMDSIRRNVWRYCETVPKSDYSHSLRALYWNHTAVFINSYGNRDSAITCFLNAYKELQLAGGIYIKDIIPVCINLADAYRQKGDASNSSRYYRRALAISDSLHNSGEKLSIYCGLGQVYSEIENYRDANEYFTRAEEFVLNDSTNNTDTYSRFHFYISSGNNFYFQKRYADALRTFRKAREIASKIEDLESHFIVDVNIGEVLLFMDSIDSAAVYLANAQKLFPQIPEDASKRFYINSLMADLELSRNNLAKASEYLSLASADSLHAGPRYLALHYSRMQHYYTLLRDYKKAYHCLTRSHYYRDSISNATVRNKIAEIDMRYVQDTTLLHSNLIISQKDDHMKRMQIQIYILLIVLLVVGSLSTIYILVRRRKRIVSEISLRNRIFSQRLANIRNRIAPHFVFNVLNRELAANNEGINNLVKLLRKNLEMCDRYTVTLAEELEFIDTYIDNERPSLGDDFSYEKIIDKKIDTSGINILAMMIHIFVENAVKHGMRALKGKKSLILKVLCTESDDLKIVVQNNCPLQATTPGSESNTGVGMRVITQTIQLLNDRNRTKMSLKVESCPSPDDKSQSIWTVTLLIPHDFSFLPIEKEY